MWALTGVLEAELGRAVALQLGYRYADIAYDEDAAGIGVDAHGPYLGIAFGW